MASMEQLSFRIAAEIAARYQSVVQRDRWSMCLRRAAFFGETRDRLYFAYVV